MPESLGFANHVTKRNEGSGDENGVYKADDILEKGKSVLDKFIEVGKGMGQNCS